MNSYCRLCLKKVEPFTNVYTKHQESTYARLIQDFFKVSILKKDTFSKVVCQVCHAIIVQTLSYRKTFLKNAIKLIKGDNNNPSEEEIECESFVSKPIPNQSLEDSDCSQNEAKTRKRKLQTRLENEEWTKTALKIEPAIDSEKKEKKIEIEMEISETVKLVQNDDNKLFKCFNCLAAFKNNSHLREHQFRNHENHFKLLYQCSKCNNSFMGTKSLEKHHKIHEIDATADEIFECGDVDKERTCAKCFLKFHALDRLRHHFKFHHEEKKKT